MSIAVLEQLFDDTDSRLVEKDFESEFEKAMEHLENTNVYTIPKGLEFYDFSDFKKPGTLIEKNKFMVDDLYDIGFNHMFEGLDRAAEIARIKSDELNNLQNQAAKQIMQNINDMNELVRSSETVNHPNHYQSESGLEAIDVIEAFKLNFHLGNVLKYILRADKKGAVEDLRKALWYLQKEIANQEEDDMKAPSLQKEYEDWEKSLNKEKQL